MTDLIDLMPQPAQPTTELSAHHISAIFWTVARGDFTKAQGITGLETFLGRTLTVDEDNSLDDLVAHYQAATAADKELFFSDVEAWGFLLEMGLQTAAQFRTRFDIRVPP